MVPDVGPDAPGHSARDLDGHHGMGSPRKDVDGPWESEEAEAPVNGGGAHAEAASSAAARETARRRGRSWSWTYITGTIHGLQPDSLLLLLPVRAPRVAGGGVFGHLLRRHRRRHRHVHRVPRRGTAELQKRNPDAVSVVSTVFSAAAVAIGVAFIASAALGFELF